MTTAYNLRNKMAISSNVSRSSRVDPGSGGTIIVSQVDRGVIELSGAGTRTLEAASGIGIGTTITCLSQTAAIVVAGATNETIGDGEFVKFEVVQDLAGANEWRIVAGTRLNAEIAASTADVDALEAKIEQTFTIDLNMDLWLIWDSATLAPLTATANTDDLGYTLGTIGTDAPLLHAVNDDAETIQYARQQVVVPSNYIAGQAISLAITVAEGAVADTDAGIDANVYRQIAPTVDINSTALQSVLSAAGTKTFVLTPTNVVPGETLDVRIFLDIDDNAGATAPTDYTITKVALVYTVA